MLLAGLALGREDGHGSVLVFLDVGPRLDAVRDERFSDIVEVVLALSLRHRLPLSAGHLDDVLAGTAGDPVGTDTGLDANHVARHSVPPSGSSGGWGCARRAGPGRSVRSASARSSGTAARRALPASPRACSPAAGQCRTGRTA